MTSNSVRLVALSTRRDQGGGGGSGGRGGLWEEDRAVGFESGCLPMRSYACLVVYVLVSTSILLCVSSCSAPCEEYVQWLQMTAKGFRDAMSLECAYGRTPCAEL